MSTCHVRNHRTTHTHTHTHDHTRTWISVFASILWKSFPQGQDTERLAGVLDQCQVLTHLDLRDNHYFGAAGVQRLPGVHLNLSHNQIVTVGTENLVGLLGQ